MNINLRYEVTSRQADHSRARLVVSYQELLSISFVLGVKNDRWLVDMFFKDWKAGYIVPRDDMGNILPFRDDEERLVEYADFMPRVNPIVGTQVNRGHGVLSMSRREYDIYYQDAITFAEEVKKWK